MSAQATITVLHYVGYDHDRGGIVSVVRALAAAERFGCVLGVNPGFVQTRTPPLATLSLPAMAGETIGWRTLWRARIVAVAVRQWLQAEPARIFHGHSRTGLLVALWLHGMGERRVVASVHCYGRQRWFYRWAARVLGRRLFWLSPAMRRYYGVVGDGWEQCIPGCVPGSTAPPPERLPRGNVVRLGGIGALVPWKGWHTVIAALAALPAGTRRRLRFRHIGGPDGSVKSRRYAEKLRALTIDAGLEGTVEWLGEQPSSGPLLRDLDCLVVASKHEPFSVAMLEALQAHVPVLAADSGGAMDIISPPVNGWLFRSGDSADLARKLTLLVEGDALARVEISSLELQHFMAPVVAGQWACIYAELQVGG